MQQLQPRVQELQAKYKNNPDKLQKETAALYQSSGVNPLAGCLPTLATLPVFIGLYRSLTQAADEGLLNEGWFFIPSLAGPTSIAARQAVCFFSLAGFVHFQGFLQSQQYCTIATLLLVCSHKRIALKGLPMILLGL